MVHVTRKGFLFFLSILITVVAFMIANEKDVPPVSSMVFGKINAIKYGFSKVCGLPIGVEPLNSRAFKMITGDLMLNPDEYGFEELSEFLMEDLKRKKPRFLENTCCEEIAFDLVKNKALKSGFSHMGYSGIPGNLHGSNVPYGNNSLRAYLKDSEAGHDYIEFYVYFLKEAIDTKYRVAAFNWALFLLIIAISIQMLEFVYFDRKKS